MSNRVHWKPTRVQKYYKHPYNKKRNGDGDYMRRWYATSRGLNSAPEKSIYRRKDKDTHTHTRTILTRTTQFTPTYTYTPPITFTPLPLRHTSHATATHCYLSIDCRPSRLGRAIGIAFCPMLEWGGVMASIYASHPFYKNF